jgi:glycosyltransferase involved in cell wall biosynthesis
VRLAVRMTLGKWGLHSLEMTNHVYDLSLVIACYNEEPLLEESVRQIRQILDNTRYSYELIFIDDCSKDRTVEIARSLVAGRDNEVFLCHEKNAGRGNTVTEGMNMAKGRICGFIDIDLETHARYIPSMALAIDNGADIAVAYRIYKIRLDSIPRWILSKGYVRLVRRLLGVNLKDTETGCKFFARDAILPILAEVKDNHWFWDTEVMARAYFAGLKIAEVPTLFLRRTDKTSSVRIVKDVIYYIRKLLEFRQTTQKLKRQRDLRTRTDSRK